MSNLNFDQVAANQNQKEVTINDAFDQVDGALTEHLTVDLSAADVTLTADQWTRNWFFECMGHTVARTVTLPAMKRPAVVKNAGTGALTLQVMGGGTAVVQAAQTVMVYNDGANLAVTGGGSSYPAMAGNAGKVLAVNAGEDGVQWVGLSAAPINADTQPAVASDWDDEFEYGTALDTTGARRAGAKPWSLIGGLAGDANPVKSGWIGTTTALKASMPVPAGTFKFRGKFTAPGSAVAINTIEAGLYVTGPSSGAGILLYNNGSKYGSLVSKVDTSLAWISDLSIVATGTDFRLPANWYYEIEYDGTNIILRISSNGIGFRTLYTGTAAALLGGAPSTIAINLKDTGSGGAGSYCDWVRRVA